MDGSIRQSRMGLPVPVNASDLPGGDFRSYADGVSSDGSVGGPKVLLSELLISALILEQKTQVAYLNVTRNGLYCIYNINYMYS